MKKNFNLPLFTEGFWLNEIYTALRNVKAAKETIEFQESNIQDIKQFLDENLQKSDYDFITEVKHDVIHFKITINCNDNQKFYIETFYSYAYKVPGNFEGGLRAYPKGITVYHSTRRGKNNAAHYSLLVDENNYKKIISNIIELKRNYSSLQDKYQKELDKAQNKIDDHNKKEDELKILMNDLFSNYAITPTNNGKNESYTIGIDSENVLELNYGKKDVTNELKEIAMKLPGFAAIIDILPGVVSIEVNNRRGI